MAMSAQPTMTIRQFLRRMVPAPIDPKHLLHHDIVGCRDANLGESVVMTASGSRNRFPQDARTASFEIAGWQRIPGSRRSIAVDWPAAVTSAAATRSAYRRR